MEVRDFPSILIFYLVVKIYHCDVWVAFFVFFFGSVFLSASEHRQPHRDVFHLLSYFNLSEYE